MGHDAMLYHSAVHNLIAGNGWSYFIFEHYHWAPVEPGFGLLSYLVFLLIGDIEYSGMIVSAASYLAIIPLTFFTVKSLFGKWVALYSAFLVTFWPTIISYSYVNLGDLTFAFLLMLAFSLYTRILFGNKSIFKAVLFGLLLGFIFLNREPEGLLISSLTIFSLVVFAIIEYRKKNVTTMSSSRWKYFFTPICALSGFVAVFIFYVLFIYIQSGVWSFSIKIEPIRDAPGNLKGHSSKFIDHKSEFSNVITNKENSLDNYLVKTASIGVPFDDIKLLGFKAAEKLDEPDPNLPTNVQLVKGLINYSPDFRNLLQRMVVLGIRLTSINFHGLVPLALVGIIFPVFSLDGRKLFQRPDKRKILLVIAFAIFISPALPHLLVSAFADRYVMQYSIFFLILFAVFTIKIIKKIYESSRLGDFEEGVAIICLVSLIVCYGINTPSLQDVLKTQHGILGIRAAGLWLHENMLVPEDVQLIAAKRGPVALFYANGKEFSKASGLNMDPEMTLEELGLFFTSEEIDYLILDNYYVRFLPQLEHLWNNPNQAAEFGLSLLHKDSNNSYQIYTGAVNW